MGLDVDQPAMSVRPGNKGVLIRLEICKLFVRHRLTVVTRRTRFRLDKHLLGVPGMVAYKMVNTLDSMIGYRNERYDLFGRVAARIDDAANFIPARLTAALMILVSGRFSLFSFVKKYGRQHLSPNAGYPEAALAGIRWDRK